MRWLIMPTLAFIILCYNYDASIAMMFLVISLMRLLRWGAAIPSIREILQQRFACVSLNYWTSYIVTSSWEKRLCASTCGRRDWSRWAVSSPFLNFVKLCLIWKALSIIADVSPDLNATRNLVCLQWHFPAQFCMRFCTSISLDLCLELTSFYRLKTLKGSY